MRIAIYHNILWAKYKGVVFSGVYAQSKDGELTHRSFKLRKPMTNAWL